MKPKGCFIFGCGGQAIWLLHSFLKAAVLWLFISLLPAAICEKGVTCTPYILSAILKKNSTTPEIFWRLARSFKRAHVVLSIVIEI